MPSNYKTNDPIEGYKDLDDVFITDAWLVDQFVGGTLFGAGYNHKGQIGNGTTTSYSSPIQIGSLTNWKQVNLRGYYHTLFVKTDGTLWACGYNDEGKLGNGTTTSYSSPIQIGSLTNWKQIAIGIWHSVAVKTDGTLWTWGANVYTYGVTGQLGLGINTGVYYSSPVQIGSLTNWKSVTCGMTHTLALKTDGTLWGWGTNSNGELGVVAGSFYSSPIQVGSLTTWKHVNAGGQFTYPYTMGISDGYY